MGMMINRRRAYGGKKGLLPSGYTQAEYLESSGTQYINTGLEGNDNYVISGKFYDAGGYCVVSGSNARYGTNYIGRISGSGGLYRLLLSKKKCDIPISIGAHTFNISLKQVVFDNIQYSWNTDNNTVGQYLYLFCGYYPTIIYGAIKLYYYQIELNGVLLRDYIPAIRNSDNVAGMYDLVNNIFYTNAGTGDFISGPEV